MASFYQDRDIADPRMNPGDEPYFDAASQGRLLLKRCSSCGAYHHYPRALCPVCLSDAVEWVDSSGTGVVYSYSVTRKGGPTAYCIAYVSLNEGVTILTNIVDCDLDSVRIGQRVKVVFKTTVGGAMVPMFSPDEGKAASA